MENRNDRFRRKYYITVDQLLIRLTTIAIILLLAVQALLLHDETRKYLSLVDKLEGDRLTTPSTMYAANISLTEPNKTFSMVNKVIAKSIRSLRSGKNITIRMITPNITGDAILTINGEIAGDFAKKKLEVTVYDGDYLEIDVTKLKGKPAQFIIDTHKNDLVAPVDGILLESQSDIITIGKVIFKQ
ncbi:MAG: hypothetical protein H6Q72_143 [Firmicutes bacterium]|nr:hypothetical protein [Bacillota bacterium]